MKSVDFLSVSWSSWLILLPNWLSGKMQKDEGGYWDVHILVARQQGTKHNSSGTVLQIHARDSPQIKNVFKKVSLCLTVLTCILLLFKNFKVIYFKKHVWFIHFFSLYPKCFFSLIKQQMLFSVCYVTSRWNKRVNLHMKTNWSLVWIMISAWTRPPNWAVKTWNTKKSSHLL